jgi:hypothetical protein
VRRNANGHFRQQVLSSIQDGDPFFD